MAGGGRGSEDWPRGLCNDLREPSVSQVSLLPLTVVCKFLSLCAAFFGDSRQSLLLLCLRSLVSPHPALHDVVSLTHLSSPATLSSDEVGGSYFLCTVVNML